MICKGLDMVEVGYRVAIRRFTIRRTICEAQEIISQVLESLEVQYRKELEKASIQRDGFLGMKQEQL